ncbi:hypothetical protein M427DRAFT_495320 [Gonapodya prolifera JEL478]|uniref:Uncharacterized protein n=1 Tax=Gonapodya prolifera (strain JEL478) TaxID=1344416 RepID=A0A139AI80_GONPJ|nr:hypothetical protein M427DRAFT_495320 [Gonapodya prolifera JEL478]|eukprot:KXS16244.1 hypothetical protein M427DRAFT_495320 [Gonapodya prolifera JEL478]
MPSLPPSESVERLQPLVKGSLQEYALTYSICRGGAEQKRILQQIEHGLQSPYGPCFRAHVGAIHALYQTSLLHISAENMHSDSPVKFACTRKLVHMWAAIPIMRLALAFERFANAVNKCRKEELCSGSPGERWRKLLEIKVLVTMMIALFRGNMYSMIEFIKRDVSKVDILYDAAVLAGETLLALQEGGQWSEEWSQEVQAIDNMISLAFAIVMFAPRELGAVLVSRGFQSNGVFYHVLSSSEQCQMTVGFLKVKSRLLQGGVGLRALLWVSKWHDMNIPQIRRERRLLGVPRKCQKADWSFHKLMCGKAEFPDQACSVRTGGQSASESRLRTSVAWTISPIGRLAEVILMLAPSIKDAETIALAAHRDEPDLIFGNFRYHSLKSLGTAAPA